LTVIEIHEDHHERKDEPMKLMTVTNVARVKASDRLALSIDSLELPVREASNACHE
jgi:hypothetical protein